MAGKRLAGEAGCKLRWIFGSASPVGVHTFGPNAGEKMGGER